MAFNILSVIDNELNIDNIDLTKNYVYVLELEDNRYYVGRTSNFIQRMNEHFTSNGSIYTKKYKPIKIKEIFEEKTPFDERDKTLEYMEKYSWEKVRGYAWCREKILKEPKIKKKKETKQTIEYIVCDDDITIQNMYELENKDVIQIGNYLNKSPGSIACSLERMGIVNRRQLSRGYFDYTFSDLYEECKKKNIVHKNKNLKNAISKSELTKDELKNIKTKIKSILKEPYKDLC
jgi:predicted GIY-YIG superfamily endonuclease